MRIFYDQWREYIIRQPLADELQRPDLQEDTNRQPMAGEMQLAVKKYDSPIGVATNKTTADMPERLWKALPDVEDLKVLLSGENLG